MQASLTKNGNKNYIKIPENPQVKNGINKDNLIENKL